MEANTLNLPVLALRGLTVFPHTNLTFDVERRISIKALEVAMESGQEIFLVTQRELNTDRPGEKDLYTMGTISRVTQILRLGKTSLRVMVEGGRRARLRRLWQTEPYLQGHVEVVEESAAVSHGPKTEALLRQTWGLFQDYAHLAGNVAEEVTAAVLDCQEPGYLADFIAQNTALRYDDKQAILEELSPLVRLRKLNGFLARERDVLGYEDADSAEFNEESTHKVIDFMPDQRGNIPKGGTMRLGAYPCVIRSGSILEQAYGKKEIQERHRHRYEFNNEYREAIQLAGMDVTGTSPDGRLVEAVEIPALRFFVGVQYHPEFKSRPNAAHPLFRELVRAAMQK